MALRTALATIVASFLFGSKVECRAPSSTWISHVTSLGYGCPSPDVTVASDSTSFTVKWDLKSLGHPLAALGPGVTEEDRKRDCAVSFVLRMKPSESNRSVLITDSERQGNFHLGDGATAKISTQISGIGMPWSNMPEAFTKTGQASGGFSFKAPAYLDPLARLDKVLAWDGLILPGRDKPFIPLACSSMATANQLGEPSGAWGPSITLMDTFEVLGPEGAVGQLGVGDSYSHTVYMDWMDPCPSWYQDRYHIPADLE